MDVSKIKKHVLPYLPYVFVFWFFNKCGEAYRMSPEHEALFKLIDMLTGLSSVMSNIMPSFNPSDLLIGLAGAVAVYGIVWYRKKNAKNWRKDVEYGSARWGA